MSLPGQLNWVGPPSSLDSQGREAFMLNLAQGILLAKLASGSGATKLGLVKDSFLLAQEFLAEVDRRREAK